MDQALISIIRPNLNLAQPFCQQVHLIEHLLLDPARLEAGGIDDELYSKAILQNNAYTSATGVVEYYVVRSEFAAEVETRLRSFISTLNPTEAYFESERKTIIQELAEYRGQYISTNEQYSRRMYTADSPTVVNLWTDPSTVESVTLSELLEVFKNHGEASVMVQSFDHFAYDRKMTLPHDVFRRDDKKVTLYHPDCTPDSVSVMLNIPFSAEGRIQTFEVLRVGLIQVRFGLLFRRLREEKGLIYDIDMNWNWRVDYLDISFDVHEDYIDEVIAEIRQCLREFPEYLEKNFTYIKERSKLWTESEWFDVAENWRGIVDYALLGNDWRTGKERVDATEQVTIDLVKVMAQEIAEKMETQMVQIEQRYAEEPSETP